MPGKSSPEANKRYYEKHREEILARARKKYRDNNGNEKQREYREKNRKRINEYHREYQRRYREKNPEAYKEYQQAYQSEYRRMIRESPELLELQREEHRRYYQEHREQRIANVRAKEAEAKQNNE